MLNFLLSTMPHPLLRSPHNPRRNTFGLWLLCLLLGLGTVTAQTQPVRPFVVRVTPAGPLNLCSGTPLKLTATAVYPEFNAGTGFNDTYNGVRAVAVQPADGKLLAGGEFKTYNGIQHKHIVRLNPDGSLDPTFRTNPDTTGGFNDNVITLVIQPTDGKVLVGGFFTKYNGTECKRVIRLNSDGSIDPTFQTSIGFDNGGILSMALQADGKVLVGGLFEYYNGNPCNRIARLNTDGSLDTSFLTGTGFTDQVKALAVQQDNKVLVGGLFTNYNGANRNQIVRLNPNGTLDTTFNIGNGFGSFGNTVWDILVQPADNKILVGGNYTSYNGTPRNRLVRLEPNGSLDPTFNASFNSDVFDLALQPNSKVVASGLFTTYNGLPHNRLIRLEANGDLDPTFQTGAGFNGNVITVFIQPSDGKILAGGQFTSYNGTPRNRIARLNTDGSFNTDATPVPVSPSITYTWFRNGQQLAGRTTDTLSITSNGEYSARTIIGGFSDTSDSVKINPPPLPIGTLTLSTNSGAAGSTITVNGNNLENVRRVFIGASPAEYSASFVLVSSTQLRVTVPDSAVNGTIKLVDLCGSAVNSPDFRVLPTLRSIMPQTGFIGDSVRLSGTGFIPTLTTVSFNGGPSSPTRVVSARRLDVKVPLAATTGKLTITNGGNIVTSADDFIVLSMGSNDLTVDNTRTLPAGTYTNITVKSPGVLTLDGNSTITGNIRVLEGATLHTGTNILSGTGSFALAAGATLSTSAPEGLTVSGSTGSVQTSIRLFSPDANYSYTGTVAQVTGNGLPGQARSLKITNPVSVTLTNPITIVQTLEVAGSGNLVLNGQLLTLQSDARGTALVVNSGGGTVVGQASVQRYINPIINRATGIRYYGSPVSGATAAVLAPAAVYRYDQSISATQRDSLPLIDYGFLQQPISATTRLLKGRGYAAAVPAATTVNFVGTLNNGDTTLTLERNISSYAYYAGWHLVSNPYPSPLDWDKVLPADRPGLEAAIYVYESTGPGKGYYRSYVNGEGTASPLIAAGQAFFVRVKEGITSGNLTFRNSQRVTDYGIQVDFNRPTRRARVRLNGGRGNGCGQQCRTTVTSFNPRAGSVYSGATVYEQPGATTRFNPDFDARASALQSRSTINLSIQDSQGEELSLKALENLVATSVLRLVFNAIVPATDYVIGLSSAEQANLPPDLEPFLRDNVRNRWVPLRDSVYTFGLTAREILNPIAGRFELHFRPRQVSGTQAPWSKAADVNVYPNPAHQEINVLVPSIPGALQVHATLRNTLGQVVRQQASALPAAGTTLRLNVSNLAGGVYILRLQAGAATVTRRVIVE